MVEAAWKNDHVRFEPDLLFFVQNVLRRATNAYTGPSNRKACYLAQITPTELAATTVAGFGESAPAFPRQCLMAIAGQPLELLRRKHPTASETATLAKMMLVVDSALAMLLRVNCPSQMRRLAIVNGISLKTAGKQGLQVLGATGYVEKYHRHTKYCENLASAAKEDMREVQARDIDQERTAMNDTLVCIA